MVSSTELGACETVNVAALLSCVLGSGFTAFPRSVLEETIDPKVAKARGRGSDMFTADLANGGKKKSFFNLQKSFLKTEKNKFY